MKAPIGDRIPARARAAALASIAAMFLAAPLPAGAQRAAEVRSILDAESVVIGQSFYLQIQVVGATQVGQPDVSALSDFDPRPMPLDRNRDRLPAQFPSFNLTEGVNYLYRMTPPRLGAIAIPPASVDVDGVRRQTPAAGIQVVEPPPSAEYKLSLALSKTRAFVGEPLRLTAVWYYLEAPRLTTFTVPILRNPAFDIPGYSAGNQGTGRYNYGFGYNQGQAPFGSPPRPGASGQGAAGLEGSAFVDGVLYRTVTYELTVIPKDAGSYDFPPSTVQIWNGQDAGSGGQRGFRDLATAPSRIVGSKAFSLTVLPLPTEGKPPGYTGIIADNATLKVAVAPDAMNVGDPVNLNVTLSGPLFLENTELPPLESLPGFQGIFTFRPEPVKTTLGKDDKTFSRTVRVKKDDVTAVPAVSVPYFNTRTGAYAEARSEPVPISVRPTRVVTAADLEARGGPVGAGSSAATLRTWEAGIFYNYGRVSDLLAPEAAGIGPHFLRPAVPALIGAPLLFLVAAFLIRARRRAADRELAEAAAAAGATNTSSLAGLGERLAVGSLEDAGDEAALHELRETLGNALGLPPGRRGRRDIETGLRERGVEEPLISETDALLGSLEDGIFSGVRGYPGEPEVPLRQRIARAASGLASHLQEKEPR